MRCNALMLTRPGLVLIAIAIVLRALLIAFSPTPFGYVWDYYHDGVQVLYHQGRLPMPADCWQCAHPPFFFIAGVPFYAFGLLVSGGSGDAGIRWLGALSILSAAITIYYGHRLLVLYRVRGNPRLLGLALLLVFPCLFISSYGADSDILLTAILSAFVYYLARYSRSPATAQMKDAVRLGILAGLGIATKASGLAALMTLGLVMVAALLFGRRRVHVLRHAGAVLVLVTLIGGWKYYDNWQRYGSPFHLSGSANEGLSLSSRSSWGDRYELTTFRLSALRRAIGPNVQTGTDLTDLEAYKSIPTTLHALAWSDMSFFSVRSRHGSTHDPYPWKFIPPNLTLGVILLGLVPAALAAAGFIVTLRRRRFQALAAFGVITMAAYIWWVLPQPSWALKTKYVLFLLPQYVLYVVIGLAWLRRRARLLGSAALLLLVALIVLCHVWLYAFAVGGL
jgi:hypothetical protein